MSVLSFQWFGNEGSLDEFVTVMMVMKVRRWGRCTRQAKQMPRVRSSTQTRDLNRAVTPTCQTFQNEFSNLKFSDLDCLLEIVKQITFHSQSSEVENAAKLLPEMVSAYKYGICTSTSDILILILQSQLPFINHGHPPCLHLNHLQQARPRREQDNN